MIYVKKLTLGNRPMNPINYVWAPYASPFQNTNVSLHSDTETFSTW